MDDDDDLGIVWFVLWRIVAAVVLGFALMILLAVGFDSMGWAVAHGGFVFVWPVCSFLALIGLVLFPFATVRSSLKSWRSRRRAAGR
jgi:uncharacterized membrane protein